MPIYRYKCNDCGKEFSFLEKMEEPRKETCPKCGGKLERLFSKPNVLYKSDGFYSKENSED